MCIQELSPSSADLNCEWVWGSSTRGSLYNLRVRQPRLWTKIEAVHGLKILKTQNRRTLVFPTDTFVSAGMMETKQWPEIRLCDTVRQVKMQGNWDWINKSTWSYERFTWTQNVHQHGNVHNKPSNMSSFCFCGHQPRNFWYFGFLWNKQRLLTLQEW